MPSATSGQTIGPFWHLIEHPEWADLTRSVPPARVTRAARSLTAKVIRTDAAVELQADPPANESLRLGAAAPTSAASSASLR